MFVRIPIWPLGDRSRAYPRDLHCSPCILYSIRLRYVNPYWLIIRGISHI